MKIRVKTFTNVFIAFLIVLLVAFLSTDSAYAASKMTIPGTSAEADSRVVQAFIDLGFTVQYDEDLAYSGVFSVGNHSITVKTTNKTHVLHELGHFLSRLEKGADETDEFMKIYKAEKKKYTGSQKSYITASSKEYFAQSFAEYTKNPKKLKKERPKTYAYVKAQVEAVDQQDIDDMYAAYGWAWK